MFRLAMGCFLNEGKYLCMGCTLKIRCIKHCGISFISFFFFNKTSKKKSKNLQTSRLLCNCLSVHWFRQDGGGPLNGINVVQSSSAIAFITVKDMPNLDPQFLNLPNLADIQENSAVVSVFLFLFFY